MRSLKPMICCLLLVGTVDKCLSVEPASQPAIVARAEFAGKLSAAAFGDAAPKSYDVVLFWTQTDAPSEEKVVRERVKEFYEKTDKYAANPLGSKKGNADFEAEVKRIMQEQNARKPQRRIVRLRKSLDRFRVDEARLTEGEEFDSKRAFEQTQVFANGLFMQYTHGNRQAYIKKEADLPGHYDRNIRNWFVCPEEVRVVGVLLFGTRDPQNTTGAIASAERVDAFVREGYTWVSDVRSTTDRNGRQTHEYEVDLTKGMGLSLAKVICDAQDYRRLRSFETVMGSERTLVRRVRISRADQSGQVSSVSEETWERGALKKALDVTVVEAHFDINLPDELFRWAPPKGYLCTDARLEKPVMFEVGSADDPGSSP